MSWDSNGRFEALLRTQSNPKPVDSGSNDSASTLVIMIGLELIKSRPMRLGSNYCRERMLCNRVKLLLVNGNCSLIDGGD